MDDDSGRVLRDEKNPFAPIGIARPPRVDEQIEEWHNYSNLADYVCGPKMCMSVNCECDETLGGNPKESCCCCNFFAPLLR